MIEKEPASSPLGDIDESAVPLAAAEWWATLQDRPVSAETQRAFHAWMRESPDHEDAFHAMGRAWMTSSEASTIKRAQTSFTRRQFVRNASIFAGATAAAGMVAYVAQQERPFAQYRTARGQRTTISLDDGSRIELSTQTALDVKFTSAERRLLLHHGEVCCRVAPDAARPFRVESSLATATALGTEFSVLAEHQQARIAVTEHSVNVATNRGEQAIVQEGHIFTVDASGTGASLPISPSTLAWRSGRLEFFSAPLGDVAASISRWKSGTILFTDGQLRSLPVTMLVDLNRIPQTLEKLPSILPVRVQTITPLLTIIRPA